jgi:small-conductance mechanosensitive channel
MACRERQGDARGHVRIAGLRSSVKLIMSGGIMQSTISGWSEAFMTSLTGALAMFFAAIPKVLGFAIILVAGWFIASAIEKGLVALLHAVRFNNLADRAGLSQFVQKTNTKTDASGMIAGVVKWFVRLIALVVAFDALGLPAVSDVLRQLLMWLPNLVVAMVALVIGGLAANAMGNLVRGAAAEGGLDRPDFLAKVAKTAVWAFAIVIAVNQIGIATTLVNTLFMATVGAVALALGLSFGIGGRDTAGEIVRKWYNKGREKAPQIERAADAAGRMADQRSSADALRHGDEERRSGSGDRRTTHGGPSILQ